jgi:hypothetical protein
MSENPSNPEMENKGRKAMFDHEKLDVYHLELKNR